MPLTKDTTGTPEELSPDTTFEYSVSPRTHYVISLALSARAPHPKGALILLTFLGHDGTPCPPPYTGFLFSPTAGAPFHYAPVGAHGKAEPVSIVLDPPQGAARARLTLRPWGAFKKIEVTSGPEIREVKDSLRSISGSESWSEEVRLATNDARLRLRVHAFFSPTGLDRAGALSVKAFDADGKELTIPLEGFAQSAELGLFQYLDGRKPALVEFDIPPGVRSVGFAVRCWRASRLYILDYSTEVISIRGEADPTAGPVRLRRGTSCSLRCRVDQSPRLLVSGRAISHVEDRRAGIARIAFLDDSEQSIDGPYEGCAYSDHVGNFRYLAAEPGAGKAFELSLVAPPSAATLLLQFEVWNLVEIEVRALRVRGAARAIDASRARRESDDLLILRESAREAARVGELREAVAILSDVYSRTLSSGDRIALELAKSSLQELAIDWSPQAPVNLRLLRGIEPNRICHLFREVLPFDSSEESVCNRNIVQSERLAGLDPFVVTPLLYPAGDVNVGSKRRLFEDVRYYHLVPGGRDDSTVPTSDRLQYDAIWTAAVIAREAPSVIRAGSGVRGYEFALKALPIGRKLGIPFVYDAQSWTWSSLEEVNGVAGEASRMAAARELQCMRDADHVIAGSQADKLSLSAAGISEEKISVVPDAVCEALLQQPSSHIEAVRSGLRLPAGVVVGYIWSMENEAQNSAFIAALSATVHKKIDIACLLILTRGRQEYLEVMPSLPQNLKRCVVAVEPTKLIEAIEYFSAIDIYVSNGAEAYNPDWGCRLGALEALLLEKELLVSAGPDSSEIVGSGERGLLYRSGDADDLAQKLRLLLSNRERGKVLARAGRIWVLGERVWGKNGHRYAAIYRELFERSKYARASA